jgi:hypothetical protein
MFVKPVRAAGIGVAQVSHQVGLDFVPLPEDALRTRFGSSGEFLCRYV